MGGATVSPRERGPRAVPTVDLDKLRDALRGIGDEYLHRMLVEALEQLPPTKLAKVVGRYIDLAQLAPDPAQARPRSVLQAITDFDARSRAGHYYEGFNVNSKNYREMSKGTRAFIVDCLRYFDAAVALVANGDPREGRAAFTLLLELLRRIDQCYDDIIFFADEAGSWQVDVDWDTVLPAWFKCLAETAEPAEFARLAVGAIDDFKRFERDKHISQARRVATAAQRLALDAAASAADTARRRT